MKQLKALSAPGYAEKVPHKSGVKSGISDCCICLFSVTVHQSLFIAPCSHVFHYKCIRPMLNLHHPGFSCPLCRTFANLEEDVEVDFDDGDADADTDNAEASGSGEGPTRSGTTAPDGNRQRETMDVDMLNVSAVLNAANEVAAQLHSADSTSSNLHPSGSGPGAGVESDFMPERGRGENDYGAATLVRGGGLGRTPSTGRHGAFENVPESADEYALAETEAEYNFGEESEREGTAALPGSGQGAGRSLSPGAPMSLSNSPSSAVSPTQQQFVAQMPIGGAGPANGFLGAVVREVSGDKSDGATDPSEEEGDASGSSAEGVGMMNMNMRKKR